MPQHDALSVGLEKMRLRCQAMLPFAQEKYFVIFHLFGRIQNQFSFSRRFDQFTFLVASVIGRQKKEK